MFDIEDLDNIWVSPDAHDGNGTFDRPFDSLSKALFKAKPGNRIILKEGTYSQDQTIEISGSADRPIEICADHGAKVAITGACWYFYDTSDLVVSGFTFKDSPRSSISVIGNCKRNSFHNLSFYNCGTSGKASCTIFFGGSGARFNMVENCTFEHSVLKHSEVTSKNASVALMVSEGSSECSSPIKNHIFRRNTLRNYDYGIMVGSKNRSNLDSGHIVEYNTIENCKVDGILVRVGDTRIRGNKVYDCGSNSISIITGTGSVVENNRILEGNCGIRINGSGHTVHNNCIVRCSLEAVRAGGVNGEQTDPASNLFIQENTFIDCGKENRFATAGISIEQGTTCIIEKNLVHGSGKPYSFEYDGISGHTECVVKNNICSGNCETINGFSDAKISFKKAQDDNYENMSGYGASGSILGPDPRMDEPAGEIDYLEASILENEEGELIVPDEGDENNILSRFYSELFNPDNHTEPEI